MARIRNTHDRVIPAPADAIGRLMSTLGSHDDELWPNPAWPPMRLDRPLSLGADGGHGPIRYRVSEHDPGRRVRFSFHPETGIDGFHEFVVEPLHGGDSLVRHVVEGVPRGTMRLLWPVVIRPIHDAVLEDLLDTAERATTGGVVRSARWSTWVRILRHVNMPRPRSCAVPDGGRLAHRALDEVDVSAAISLKLGPGVSTDPQEWADTIFGNPPRWVVALLLLRESLVRLVGIERAGRSAFDTLASDPGEVLLGTDEDHLDFRASVLVDEQSVTLTTLVRLNNRRGHLYWAVVRHVHPFVVRSMLGRAAHRLADRAWAIRTDAPADRQGVKGRT